MAWLCKECTAITSDKKMEWFRQALQDIGGDHFTVDSFCPECGSIDLNPVIEWDEKAVKVG